MTAAAGRRGICSHGAQHGKRPGASPRGFSSGRGGGSGAHLLNKLHLPLGCVSRSERAFSPSGEGGQIHTHDHTKHTVLRLGNEDSSSLCLLQQRMQKARHSQTAKI